MKKLFSILLLSLSSVSIWAEEVDKPIVCDSRERVLRAIMDGQYREVPYWGGVDKTSRYSLLVNKSTGSWTFIQFNADVACILGVGEGSFTISARGIKGQV